jgi:hypothetical protein
VIAAALAILAWNDQVRTKLMSQGFLYEAELNQKDMALRTGVEIAGPRMVRSYMKDLGILYNKTENNASVRMSKNRLVNRT